jgi:hypothetical protein
MFFALNVKYTSANHANKYVPAHQKLKVQKVRALAVAMLDEFRHIVARQDTGYEFCEVQRKGKVKGDEEECRQRAWTQMDDRFVNARRET